MERASTDGSETEAAVESSESAKGGNGAEQLIGAFVGRDSSDGNGKLLLGKVLTFDAASRLFTIFYENGRRDVLERGQVDEILMMDQKKLSQRKRKLDHLAAGGETTRPNTRSRKNNSINNPSDVAQAPLPCRSASEEGEEECEDDDDDDGDSSSESCDNDHTQDSSSPAKVQVLLLPESSGDIDIPEEYIPYLFSVYNFLRSFSLQLFLSPFGLHDFVGSLNCTVQNSLSNAIHLSLMQVLRRHLEMLSSEDSKLASRCLRHCDWSLLDSLTWPTILAGYVHLMGYMKQLDKKWFSSTVSGGEYHGLPVGLKLKALQILCDDVVDSAEIRTVLETQEDMEEEIEFSSNTRELQENGPRRVHPKNSKTSACKSLEVLENSVETKMTTPNSKISVQDTDSSDAGQDGNSDECCLCGMDGMLICCDGCPSAYHSRCIGLNKAHLPDGSWYCPECVVNKLEKTSSRIGRKTSGGEIFGTDANGRMFLGTCNYLLVVGISLNSEPLVRYYNSDNVSEVINVISAEVNASSYADICRGISGYWEVPSINMQSEKAVPICNTRFQASFKPQGYVNLYIQGDVSASAAVKLAVLASEESKVLESRNSSNPRSNVAANIVLQMKAFSGATSNFFWLGFDNKLMEIPRERCGWCVACKTASTCKRGCLLNVAATNATSRFTRDFSVVRPIKHIESHLVVVAAQVAHMEESLRGLIAGPLSDVHYNKEWHKLAREASSCKVLKFLLLELEKNIREISFSGDWTKLADDWLAEDSSAASSTCRTGTNKKYGPGRKRHRKHSGASELENDNSDNSWKNVLWWRGGKLSKVLFQKGVIPRSLVKKASRQGGPRRISGIHYTEASDLPRRSRQLTWRASVEMSKNASQLALQVRYLDANLRWKDLSRPEQSSSDKGSDVGMAFRNAVICDKKITENKTKYALTFSSQKHLPLRIMKNILETELLDGSEKLWFWESHIPLFLIKEYEEKVGLTSMPPSMILKSCNLLRLQNRQLKDRGDIFSYLMHKGEKPSRLSCASCQQDVLLRDSAKCHTCQGYYHRDCTVASIAVEEDDMELLFTCKLCCAKLSAPILGNKETLKAQVPLQGQHQQRPLQGQNQQRPLQGQHQQRPLQGQNQQRPLQGQNQHQPTVIFNRMLQSKYPNPAMTVSSAIKSSASGTNNAHKAKRGGQNSPYGLIWKKKKDTESGQNFRMNNIMLKGKEGSHPTAKITCFLCEKPYCSELMYIRCENCPKWYHADALQLEEAQIFDLVGFKCCMCRRKVSPKCPFLNSEYSRQGNAGTLPPVNTKTPRQGDNPLLCSFVKVEPIGEHLVNINDQLRGPMISATSQQKLSVRRPLSKHEKGADEVYANPKCNGESFPNAIVSGQPIEWGSSDAKEEPLEVGEPNLISASEMLLSTSNACVEAIAPGSIDLINNGEIGDGVRDGMQYEPQTYFSFTELLASDDQLDNQYDMSMDTSMEWSSIGFETVTNDDMGSGNEFGVPKVPCHMCKVDEPSPDLMCENCELCIHPHCSPWEDCEGTQWRCGNCRDWK